MSGGIRTCSVWDFFFLGKGVGYYPGFIPFCHGNSKLGLGLFLFLGRGWSFWGRGRAKFFPGVFPSSFVMENLLMEIYRLIKS